MCVCVRWGGEMQKEEVTLPSLGTTGLDVLPTGLECLGPLPGIFSPLDFSMFILQWQDLRAPSWVTKTC